MKTDVVKFENGYSIAAGLISVEPDFTLFVTEFSNVLLSYIMQSRSDVPVIISYDGINQHDYLPAGPNQSINLKFAKNVLRGIPKGRKIYLSIPAWVAIPIKGNIYFSGIIK